MSTILLINKLENFDAHVYINAISKELVNNQYYWSLFH